MTKGVAMRYGDIEERSLSERLTEILGDAAQAARVLAEIRRPSRRMIEAGLREEDRHVLGWKPETCHGSADLCLAMVVDAMIKAELDEMRHQMALVELTAEFDQNLAELKAPEVREQIETAMASRGRVTPRPKAGA
jgi:hypothetical protein